MGKVVSLYHRFVVTCGIADYNIITLTQGEWNQDNQIWNFRRQGGARGGAWPMLSATSGCDELGVDSTRCISG